MDIARPRRIRAWWRTRARPFWRDIRWIVIGLAAVTAVVLGYVGFDQHAVTSGRSFGDKLYLSLQLFAIESGAVAPPVPWELEVARVLAPAVAVYAAASAIAALLREQLQLVRVRLMRDHVVVCGLGGRGLALARGFNARGDRVVAIEEDGDARGIGECREEGIVVLTGDATDRTMLRKARVGRAGHVVAVAGDDGVNAEVAADLPDLLPERRRPLAAFVHVTDPRLCALLRRNAIESPAADSHRLDFFSVYEIAARALVSEYLPFGRDNGAVDGRDGMVVVGLGQLGEALVVHAAKAWHTIHGRPGRRLRVTVVDRVAERKCASLSLRYPQLGTVCDLACEQIDIEGPEFARAAFLAPHTARPGGSVVFLCVDDDALGLAAAQALVPKVRGNDTPIVVRMSRRAGLAALVDEAAGPGHPESLRAFPLLERACTPELVLDGTRELLARVIHEDYLRNQRELGETAETKSAVVDWDELDEQFKESNRRQADHIGFKLSSIGCGLEPLTDWDAQLFEFVPAEVEALALMEHVRWSDERAADGWRPGPDRDDARKVSPYLVEWDSLPDDVREIDRTIVRGLPAFLAQAGFHVYRQSDG